MLKDRTVLIITESLVASNHPVNYHGELVSLHFHMVVYGFLAGIVHRLLIISENNILFVRIHPHTEIIKIDSEAVFVFSIHIRYTYVGHSAEVV